MRIATKDIAHLWVQKKSSCPSIVGDVVVYWFSVVVLNVLRVEVERVNDVDAILHSKNIDCTTVVVSLLPLAQPEKLTIAMRCCKHLIEALKR